MCTGPSLGAAVEDFQTKGCSAAKKRKVEVKPFATGFYRYTQKVAAQARSLYLTSLVAVLSLNYNLSMD